MGAFVKDDFLDDFAAWPAAYIPYGGADFGEIVAVGQVIGTGDESAYYDAWVAAGDRLLDEAGTARSAGHRQSASALYLRASAFYATSYHPLYGSPPDPRLLSAFAKQTAAFETGLGLRERPGMPLSIPFENIVLPGVFLPADGATPGQRPLIIFTNGYDATMTDMYFASAVAANRRGYHVLLFDGPGQGDVLYNQGVHLRPDWETVIRAVVDVAVTLDGVDPTRIALSGWSLGGYLSLRAASGEHRLAACVADPGQWSIADGFVSFATQLGATPDQAADLGTLDQPIVDAMMTHVKASRTLSWNVLQRGFWVNGVDNLRDYLASAQQYTMEGRLDQITCPTAVTVAENDSIGAAGPKVVAALTCPKELIRFTAAEGAGDHCEMKNRSLLNQRVLDWLDTILRTTDEKN